MAIPTLAPNSTWFSQGGTTVTRASITEINIVDSYTPTGNETASWDASAAKDGGVMCYVNGTVLTIAGNGSGKIYANADSSEIFGVVIEVQDAFSKVTAINGADKLDTSGTTNLTEAFNGCHSLEVLDVSSWDVSKVESFFCTFQNCRLLKSCTVADWNTSSCTDMGGTFVNCFSLETCNLSNWDVSKVTTTFGMFSGCTALRSLKATGWNLVSGTDMTQMFARCNSLQNLDLSDWDTTGCKKTVYLFYGCASLQRLDLSSWDTTSCTDMRLMFSGMDNLQKITLGEKFSFNGNGNTLVAVLPTPPSGSWYDRTGKAYAPSAIPSNTARTYYASLALVDAALNPLSFIKFMCSPKRPGLPKNLFGWKLAQKN